MNRMTWRALACARCGLHSDQRILEHATSTGFADLDMRPPSGMRETMESWVHRCPGCNYCAPDLSKCVPLVHIEYPEYGAALNDTSVPELARRFLALACLWDWGSIGLGDRAAACRLAAAWVCDDVASASLDSNVGPPERKTARAAAVRCRREAVKTLDLTTRFPTEVGMTRSAVLVDMLRRSSQYAKAKSECYYALSTKAPSAPLRRALRYQLKLIAKHDSARHNGSECDAFDRRRSYDSNAPKLADRRDFSTAATPENRLGNDMADRDPSLRSPSTPFRLCHLQFFADHRRRFQAQPEAATPGPQP